MNTLILTGVFSDHYSGVDGSVPGNKHRCRSGVDVHPTGEAKTMAVAAGAVGQLLRRTLAR
jgi:hypothetical protein